MNFIRFVVKTQSSINILLKFKDNYLQAKEHKMYQILFIYWNQVIFSQIQSWKRTFVIGSRSHKKPYIIILNVTKYDLIYSTYFAVLLLRYDVSKFILISMVRIFYD